ncbi:MAG: di-heme oxidoredictase family protein [Sulfurovum sp.]
MNKSYMGYLLLASIVTFTACTSSDDEEVAIKIPAFAKEKILGGDTTDVEYQGSSHAFSQPAANLNGELLDYHLDGDGNFEVIPQGLGPVFNHNTCNACHQRDGRDSLPLLLDDKEYLSSFIIKDSNGWHKLNDEGTFLRISIENNDTNSALKDENNCWGAPVPVPNFSDQLFHRGVAGARDGSGNIGTGQADVWMKYGYKNITYPDGVEVKLSYPILAVDNPYDAPDNPNEYNSIKVESSAISRLFRPDVKMGIRIGMPMIGLGLLNAIAKKDILALADVNDSNNDNISGRANWVCDKEKYDKCKEEKNCDKNPPISLGRFGWKANTPTVAHQGLGALRGDMGVTNVLFKNESTNNTDLMNAYKVNNSTFSTVEDTNITDVDEVFAKSIIFYSETLSVPPRRDVENSDVQEGGALFNDLGCVKCHTPSFTTASSYTSFSVDNKEIKALTNQKIYPFTDMLLHDMGDDLADGRKDFEATGNEWKTRPLWGIGLTQTVNPGAGFLHDGRAKTLEEAILWHGGESEAIKLDFMKLKETQRAKVIKFLESL